MACTPEASPRCDHLPNRLIRVRGGQPARTVRGVHRTTPEVCPSQRQEHAGLRSRTDHRFSLCVRERPAATWVHEHASGWLYQAGALREGPIAFPPSRPSFDFFSLCTVVGRPICMVVVIFCDLCGCVDFGVLGIVSCVCVYLGGRSQVAKPRVP